MDILGFLTRFTTVIIPVKLLEAIGYVRNTGVGFSKLGDIDIWVQTCDSLRQIYFNGYQAVTIKDVTSKVDVMFVNTCTARDEPRVTIERALILTERVIALIMPLISDRDTKIKRLIVDLSRNSTRHYGRHTFEALRLGMPTSIIEISMALQKSEVSYVGTLIHEMAHMMLESIYREHKGHDNTWFELSTKLVALVNAHSDFIGINGKILVTMSGSAAE